MSDCKFRRNALRCATCVFIALVLGCKPSPSPKVEHVQSPLPVRTPEPDVVQPLDIGALLEGNELDQSQAEAELTRRLLQTPNDSESLFWLARLRATQGRLQEAVQLLETVPSTDAEASLAAAGQSAQWLEALGQYDEAVERYQWILTKAPDAAVVLRPLARILNRQGRRVEAGPLVIELCRQGDIEEEELRSLLTWSHAFSSDNPNDAFSTIGLLGRARIVYSLADYQQVIDLLEPVAFQSNPAAHSLYGRSIAMLQNWDRWKQWQDTTVPECANHADYWYARGLHALLTGEAGPSAYYFSEAILRDPTDHTAYVRYSEALARIGMQKESKLASNRADLLRSANEIAVEFARGHRDADRCAMLADLLDSLQRSYEALAWRAVALGYVRGSLQPEVVSQLEKDLQSQRQQLQQKYRRPSEQELLCGIDRNNMRERFAALTSEVAPSVPEAPRGPKREMTQLTLLNVAGQVGLVHTYDNHNSTSPKTHGILQEMGSGVAVTDFDLDGRPDVYLPQAAATPMRRDGVKPNILFRNMGDHFDDVTVPAAADDRSFSQGATAGDVNQDGFPDLCVANVGHNVLLINNGDGTFNATLLAPDTKPLWTSSLAIGDVTGDHLPDIVEINYIDDPRSIEVHESPNKFQHAIDQIHFSNGRGGYVTATLGEQPSSGLGVVMTDLDGDLRNEVFVSNDGRPDRLWMQSSEADSDSTQDVLRIPTDSLPSHSANHSNFLCDRALQRGCSVGFQGLAGASMGIAVDDFNLDGRPDLFVTQFFQEPDVFYLQTENGTFVDRSVQLGTYEPSLKVLGFGTQSIDLDNDSFVEIAVLNGHTARSSNPSIPYEMLPQIYRRDSIGKYTVEEVSDSSGYWHTRVLGRGLSKLDWNRDGQVDLVAVHLDVPTALLENRTESSLHWLELRLVGTTSERDAIGASVTVETPDLKRTVTVTSGDGYCGKNESVLHFGLADANSAEAHVQWPSGNATYVRLSALNQRWLIIEGDDTAHDDSIASQ